MAYYVRSLVNVLYGKYFQKRSSFLEKYVWKSRVSMLDVDRSLKVNDIGYLQIAEQARWSWSSCCNLLGLLSQKKASPVVSLISCNIKQPLYLFQSFSVICKVVHVDDKAFYVTQKFIANDSNSATLFIKLQLATKHGVINPLELFHTIYPTYTVPRMEIENQKNALQTFYVLESYLLEKPMKYS